MPQSLFPSPFPSPSSRTSSARPSDAAGEEQRHVVRRVRHELKRRRVRVQAVTRLTPHMLRVTFHGPDLAGFPSVGFDDHIKLILPRIENDIPSFPDLSADGRTPLAGGAPAIMRDYTPGHFDPDALTLDVDFALHEAGPATAWALQAQPGQEMMIGGPKGSFLIPDDFDWYLLMGDETALPAIGRRLRTLPPHATALVFVEVASSADELSFSLHRRTQLTWLHRDGRAAGETDLLEQALARTDLPEGEGYCWIAGETLTAKRLRHMLVARGQPGQWIRASGYWKRGAAGFHDSHAD